MSIDLAAVQRQIEAALKELHAATPRARLRRIQVKDYTERLWDALLSAEDGIGEIHLQEIAGPRLCSTEDNPRYIVCDRLDVTLYPKTGTYEVHAMRINQPGTPYGEPFPIRVTMHQVLRSRAHA